MKVSKTITGNQKNIFPTVEVPMQFTRYKHITLQSLPLQALSAAGGCLSRHGSADCAGQAGSGCHWGTGEATKIESLANKEDQVMHSCIISRLSQDMLTRPPTQPNRTVTGMTTFFLLAFKFTQRFARSHAWSTCIRRFDTNYIPY